MNYHVNKNIFNTPRVFPKQERKDCYRYDANENSVGLPSDFVEMVKKEITPEFLAMYPEPDRFLHKYADYIGVDFENVYATNGSDHGIRVLLETFGEPGKDVVTVSPTFEIYWVCCKLLGLIHKPVLYNDDFTITIEQILDAITAETRVVVLLNPNSPIGNLYTEDEVEKVVCRAKEVGAIVILDEAYHYFYEKTFLEFVSKYDNVIVLRTFSKLMSLAGCRLGMVIGHPELIHYVKNSRLAYEVNSIALLFGEKILEHPEIIQKLIQEAKEGKAFFMNQLFKNGYWFMDCHGNYVLVRTKQDANLVAQKLADEKQILVHPYGNPLMKDLIRVTVGTKTSMDFFMKALLEIDK